MRKKESMTNLVIKFLFTRRGGNALLLGYVDSILGNENYSQQNFYIATSRLQKRGFIQKKDDEWIITQQGRDYVRNDRMRYTPNLIESPFKKNAKKDSLFIFDIPEDKKLYRDWLREQLKVFDYEMVQQSVWLGPSLLPKEFFQHIKDLGLEKNIRRFKINNK